MTPNSRSEPSFRLVSETAPGLKTVSVQLASSPSMNKNRAGMLVMKVPMKNQPKMCPVRRVSNLIPFTYRREPLAIALPRRYDEQTFVIRPARRSAPDDECTGHHV